MMASGIDTKAPEIFFKKNTYVAGEVMEGNVIDHTFVVGAVENIIIQPDKVRPG